MATVARARISSEDEKKSTIEVATPANLAFVFMEPATVAEQIGEFQDTVRWRLSAQVKIGLLPEDRADAETYTASLATVVLPPVHHAQQLVAIWHWPISATALSVGRPMGLVFRWESDRVRASADVVVIAANTAGAMHGFCGLFAVPFPGMTDVLTSAGG